MQIGKLSSFIFITLLVANRAQGSDFGPAAGENILKYCNHLECRLPQPEVVEAEINEFNTRSAGRISMVKALKTRALDLIESTSQEYRDLSVQGSLSGASRKAYVSLADQRSQMERQLERITEIHLSRVALRSETSVLFKEIHDYLIAAWQNIDAISDPVARKGAIEEYGKQFSNRFYSYQSTEKGKIYRIYIQSVSLKRQLESERVLTPLVDLQQYITVNFRKSDDSYRDECDLTYIHGYHPRGRNIGDAAEEDKARQLHWLDFIQLNPAWYETHQFSRHYFQIPYHEIQRARFALAGGKRSAPLTVECSHYGANPRKGDKLVEPRYSATAHVLAIGEYTYSGLGTYGVPSDPTQVLKILSDRRD